MKRGMRGALAMAAVTLGLAACGREAAPNATVTDSAGITIVTNGPEQVARVPTWTLSASPTESIVSPSGGSYNLFGVGDLVPLPGGRLAVANAGGGDVLVFGRDGKLVLRFGRQGGGPGEFRHIASLVLLPPDSLGVYDGQSRILSVFTMKGVYARDVSLADLLASAGDASGSARLVSLGGGDLALATLPGFGDQPGTGVYRPESEWLRIDAGGRRQASYGRFPGHEVFVANHMMGRPMFGRFTTLTSVGQDLVVGTGVTTQYQVRAPSGALVRLVRWPDHDRKVTSAKVDAWVATVSASLPQTQQARFHTMVQNLPHADEEPPYETVFSSDDGQIWIGGYADETHHSVSARPGPGLHWLVFGPTGSLLAKVDTPAGFEPRTVEGKRILGVYQDAMGLESIQVYGVEKIGK